MLPTHDVDVSYPEWKDIPEDKQVKANHIGCEAGTDRKKRLYIINKGGMFLWNCFHCGKSGWHRDREHFSPIQQPSLLTDKHEFVRSSMWKMSEARAVRASECDNTAARLWLAQYDMLDDPKLLYSPDSEAIMLPIYDEDRISGYQYRTFKKNRPKYVTYVDKEFRSGSYYCLSCEIPKQLVIVEDLLSSIKLNRAGIASYCLLGTSLRCTPPMADAALLWLDPDVAGQTGAIKLYKELAPMYKRCSVIHNHQPKELSIAKLQEFINVV